MLQGLRKTIGCYAPISGLHDRQEHKHKLRHDATPLEIAVGHFQTQEKAFKQFETKMRQLLDQIQVVIASMTTVVELISTIGSEEERENGCKAARKQIEQEDMERMKDSIRCAILDPLTAKVELYDQVKTEIRAWEKLKAESKMLRAVTLKVHLSRPEDKEKRPCLELDLYRVAALLQETETALLPRLGKICVIDCWSLCGIDWWSRTLCRGCCAIGSYYCSSIIQEIAFSRNANQSVQSSLSPPNQDFDEAHETFKYPADMRYNHLSCTSSSSTLSKRLSVTSDGWSDVDGSSLSTELDGVDTISGSSEDDENHVLSIAIDDFDASVLWSSKATTVGVEQHLTDKNIDTSKLGTLSSYPVVTRDDGYTNGAQGKNADDEQPNKQQFSTSTPPQAVGVKPTTPQRTRNVLSSIRKTIWGRLSYASREAKIMRQAAASITDTSATVRQGALGLPKQPCKQFRIIPYVSKSWLPIEDCLWNLDVREARSPVNLLLQTDLISSNADDILSRLLQKDDSLYSECLSYLLAEDLVRLSKVNFQLHARLVDNAPIWKKCIRSGGLSPSIRSSLWLSLFYESTPWRSSANTSRCLSADRRRSMYDQLLTKIATESSAEELPVMNNNAQLAIWFREIDVDVVRTCHRNACAKAMPRILSTMPTTSIDSLNDCPVESVLEEMVTLIVNTEVEDTLPRSKICRNPSTSITSTDVDLEAKMRRVLRAYVMYNSRVGYCQGMGFLVRFLAGVADDEADIFWLFVGFSEPKNNENLYEPGMAVLQPYLSQFEQLLSTSMPQLYTHFQAESVQVATFCTRWFLTFFLSFETLAPALVTRLLDIFIIDGWRIMFSFSLVILDELQQELLQCDMEGILRILQSPRSYMPEPDRLRQQQLVRHALAFSVTGTILSL